MWLSRKGYVAVTQKSANRQMSTPASKTKQRRAERRTRSRTFGGRHKHGRYWGRGFACAICSLGGLDDVRGVSAERIYLSIKRLPMNLSNHPCAARAGPGFTLQQVEAGSRALCHGPPEEAQGQRQEDRRYARACGCKGWHSENRFVTCTDAHAAWGILMLPNTTPAPCGCVRLLICRLEHGPQYLEHGGE